MGVYLRGDDVGILHSISPTTMTILDMVPCCQVVGEFRRSTLSSKVHACDTDLPLLSTAVHSSEIRHSDGPLLSSNAKSSCSNGTPCSRRSGSGRRTGYSQRDSSCRERIAGGDIESFPVHSSPVLPKVTKMLPLEVACSIPDDYPPESTQYLLDRAAIGVNRGMRSCVVAEQEVDVHSSKISPSGTGGGVQSAPEDQKNRVVIVMGNACDMLFKF